LHTFTSINSYKHIIPSGRAYVTRNDFSAAASGSKIATLSRPGSRKQQNIVFHGFFKRFESPNAGSEPRLEAGAQRTLEGVAWTPLILIEAPSSAYPGGMLIVEK
jgi:hypothetical protein